MFGFTGLKGHAGGLRKSGVKSLGSTEELRPILPDSSSGEESGMAGVGVKSVDIGWNTSGEGDSLAQN